jgi:phytoene synthase
VRQPREPALASLKLAWWREEIELLAIGEPRHPITAALADCSTLRSARPLWLALADAARRDLERAPHATLPALHAYCGEAGALYELLALALDCEPAHSERARALGAAAAQARLVCSAQRNAASGRIELPLDMLAARDLQRAQLLGPWPAHAIGLLAELGADARLRLDEALAAIAPPERPALQSCLIMAELQSARLARLCARRYAAARAELASPLRLWIAWRAARRCAGTG